METESAHLIYTRTFHIGPRRREMILQVAHQPSARLRLQTEGDNSPGIAILSQRTQATQGRDALMAGVFPQISGGRWLATEKEDLRLAIPPGDRPLKFTLWFASLEDATSAEAVVASLANRDDAVDLTALTHGGPPRWPNRIATPSAECPFAIAD